MKFKPGSKHPNWGKFKLDTTSKSTGGHRAQSRFVLGMMCERCGKKPAVDRHHKDGNPLNNSPKNIERLCHRCHMIIDGRLEKLKLRIKKLNADPKRRAAEGAKIKAKWADPEWRAAQLAKIKAGRWPRSKS
jgi:hypothetical protein